MIFPLHFGSFCQTNLVDLGSRIDCKPSSMVECWAGNVVVHDTERLLKAARDLLSWSEWSPLLYLGKNWWWGQRQAESEVPQLGIQDEKLAASSQHLQSSWKWEVCSCSPFMTSSVNFTHGCSVQKYFPDLTCLQHWHLKLKPLPSWSERRVLTDCVLTLWGWKSGNGSFTIFKQIKMHFDL